VLFNFVGRNYTILEGGVLARQDYGGKCSINILFRGSDIVIIIANIKYCKIGYLERYYCIILKNNVLQAAVLIS
jgi:hypothetical protein